MHSSQDQNQSIYGVPKVKYLTNKIIKWKTVISTVDVSSYHEVAQNVCVSLCNYFQWHSMEHCGARARQPDFHFAIEKRRVMASRKKSPSNWVCFCFIHCLLMWFEQNSLILLFNTVHDALNGSLHFCSKRFSCACRLPTFIPQLIRFLSPND